MFREVFVNFSVLVTMAVFIGVVVTASNQFMGTWLRKVLFGLAGLACSLVVMQFAVQIAPGVIVDFRNVAPAIAGLYGGIPFSIAVGLPTILYRYSLGGVGAMPDAVAITVCAVAAGLLRIGSGAFYQRSMHRMAWRAVVIFGAAHASLLLVPNDGLRLFMRYWAGLVLTNSVGLLICIYVLQSRLTVQRHLDEVTLLANTDALTGLPNQRSFHLVIRSIESHTGCLLLIDIDHFKSVNDTFGHAVGDEVLRGVANVIRRVIRTHDLAFRYGGEEFAVVLTNCSLREAAEASDRLRRAVSDWQLNLPNAQPIRVTISGGLVPIHSDLHTNELFATADQLLYLAKQTGRNRIATWSAEEESGIVAH